MLEISYAVPPLMFIVGAIIGSYVITWLSRVKVGMRIKDVFDVNKKGRCFCFSCRTKLKASDMIPIYSFIKNRGKCGYCSNSIGISVFICEIGSGVVWCILGVIMIKGFSH